MIKKAKTEGYDGQEGNDVTSQWDFSGALLYSVTVITTIGKHFINCYKNPQNTDQFVKRQITISGFLFRQSIL